METVWIVLGVLLLAAALVYAGPPFVRGFREARARRGIDINMERRIEQERAEQQARRRDPDPWRKDLDAELDERVAEWRQEQA